MIEAAYFKTICKRFATLFVLLALASGCHKPSTRLNPQIQFCEDILLNLPAPDDVDPGHMQAVRLDKGLPLQEALPKGSREYNAFKSACDTYDGYWIEVNSDRKTIHIFEGDPDRDKDIKEYKDKMQAGYQATKEAFRDAAEILRQIQANE